MSRQACTPGTSEARMSTLSVTSRWTLSFSTRHAAVNSPPTTDTGAAWAHARSRHSSASVSIGQQKVASSVATSCGQEEKMSARRQSPQLAVLSDTCQRKRGQGAMEWQGRRMRAQQRSMHTEACTLQKRHVQNVHAKDKKKYLKWVGKAECRERQPRRAHQLKGA